MPNSAHVDASRTCCPLPPSFADSEPLMWTTAQVEDWLLENHFSDCIDILCRQCHIDGRHLISLKEHEIISLTKNAQLWSYIRTLTNGKQQAVAIELEPSVLRAYTACEQIEDQLATNCCLVTSMRSDRKKTLFAFLMVLATIYFCALTITIVDERLPDPKSFPPLPDLILENIEEIPWAFAVTEKIIVLKMTTLATVIALHRHR